MAVTSRIRQRIVAFACETAKELDAVDDSDALSWLDATETQAVEIGDAMSTELLERRAAREDMRRKRFYSGRKTVIRFFAPLRATSSPLALHYS